MHDYKNILGVVTILIAIVSYSNYLFTIFKGCTMPRSTSWLIWGVLNAIAFVVQHSAGGGPGSWITGFTAVICFVIATIAHFRCGRHLTKYDIVSLVGAAVTLLLWWLTSSPTLAIVLATSTYAIGFIPTMHNVLSRPNDETALTYGLNGTKFLIAIFALDSYSLTTWLYPAAVCLLNVVMVVMIVTRRRKLS